jgi:hypothetical protein
MLVSVQHRINCVLLLYVFVCLGLVFGHRAANLNGGKNSGLLLYDQAVFVLVCFVFFSFLSVTRFIFPFSLTVMLISAKTPAEQQQQRQEQHERRKPYSKKIVVVYYLDNDESLHAHRSPGFMSSLLPQGSRVNVTIRAKTFV